MSRPIQGKDCIFQVDLGAGYVTVACIKNFTVDLTVETKEITSEEDGEYKDFDYKSKTASVNGEGVLRLQDGITPNVFDFADYQDNFLEMRFRAVFYDPDGLVNKVFRGEAIVESCNLNANPSQLADGSFKLLVKGKYFLETALPDNASIVITSTGDNSIAGLVKFRLINADGETIFDSGLLPGASGGNLAHPVNVTGTVQKGMYYIYWQATVDSELNEFSTDALPTLVTDFTSGTSSENTTGVQLYDFTSDRAVTFTLGVPAPPPVCVPPAIVGSPALPDAVIGEAYTYSFSVNGSATFNLSNITKPAWLNITPLSVSTSGCVITFTGTPGVGDDGVGIFVSFDINNACGTVSFSDTIVVSTNPDLINIAYTFTTVGFGTFRINKNGGAAITPLTASGSGNINAVPGDVMQVQVTKVGGTKHIVVTDSVSGDLYNVTNGNTTNSFSWTAVLGSDYTITATIS